MKVLRYSLVAAAAILAAACGDKVQVVGPNNNAITSVQVSPASATISVGQSVTLTAAVNAAPGVTPVVTWSVGGGSSAVTVSATGVVLGVSASPGVAVCALATSGTSSLTDCATVIVQPPTAVVPAVLQIASITTQAGLNNPAPIAPAATGGQLNVSVNLNPGTEQMDSVVVLMNGIPAATTTFTSAQAAALRSAANAAGASQALQQTLVFPINTAAYATGGCATQVAPCGKATFGNGPAVFSAIGYGKQGGTAATNSTTQGGQNYLIANPDAWILTQTLGTGFNSATSAAGFNYVGGPTASVSVTAVPVSYSGLTVASANVNYGNAACDASGSGQRVQPLTAPVAPSLAWTATFARTGTGTAHAADVNNYEFNAAVCTGANAAGGEGASIASVLYTNNTTGATGFAAGSPIPVARLDNRAPGQGAGTLPSFIANPNGRLNGWINAAVSFTTKNAVATPNGEAVAGTPDAGVGGYVFNVRVGAPGAGGIVDPVLALTPSTTFTIPTPSLANTAYCVVLSATDLLGNESVRPAAGTVCTASPVATGVANLTQSQMFGVDIAPPTIAFSGGLAAGSSGMNGLTGASVGGAFQVTVLDTGAIGNSGMNAASPVVGTVTIRTAAVGLTAVQLCPVGLVVSSVCTAAGGTANGFAAPAFPLVATGATLTADAIIGYYTYVAVAVDAAGNSSSSVSRTVAYNPAANVPTLTGSLFNSPLNGPTATFTANGSSGNTTANSGTTFFDLWEAFYGLTYSAGLPGVLFSPPSLINTFNSATLANRNIPVTVTIPFIRQIQAQTSACNAALAVGATGVPDLVSGALVDQVLNISPFANTAILPAQVTAGVSFLGAAAGQQVFTSIVGNGVTEQPTGGCPLAAQVNAAKKVSGGGTSPDAASITLQNDVWGPTATFAAPFTQVNFYVLVAGNLEQIGTTSTFTANDDGSANGRKYSYTLSWTPGPASPVNLVPWAAQSSAACAVPTAVSIYAIGVSPNGDGLVAPASNNICITTAP